MCTSWYFFVFGLSDCLNSLSKLSFRVFSRKKLFSLFSGRENLGLFSAIIAIQSQETLTISLCALRLHPPEETQKLSYC